jgi:hypothetical protein
MLCDVTPITCHWSAISTTSNLSLGPIESAAMVFMLMGLCDNGILLRLSNQPIARIMPSTITSDIIDCQGEEETVFTLILKK